MNWKEAMDALDAMADTWVGKVVTSRWTVFILGGVVVGLAVILAKVF